MHRRTFAQRLALGAGSLGLLPLGVAQVSCAVDDVPVPGAPGEDKPHEPVKLADFQALAAAKLPKATFDYITTGSADEVTLRENVAAFQRIRILPPLLTGVASADPSTTVLKQPIHLPVMLAPVAGQQMFHPQGALAAARAAAAAGTVYGVSSSVGHSVEEVAGASDGPKWFQLYVPKDRAVARRLVERAERAGYQALIVTVDLGEWKDADRRNHFTLPKEVLVKHLRDVGFTHIYMDGGVRRGTDVLVALALGARAVLIGRPYAWALGADGEAGVRKVLELLRDEFLNAMVATGCARISDIRPTLLRR